MRKRRKKRRWEKKEGEREEGKRSEYMAQPQNYKIENRGRE